MKNFIISTLIYIILISSIIYGSYFNQEEFLNGALWIIWLMILLCLLLLFAKPEDLYKDKPPGRVFVRFLSFVLMMTLVVTGHFITATGWLIMWIFSFLKRKIYEEESKNQSA